MQIKGNMVHKIKSKELQNTMLVIFDNKINFLTIKNEN